MEKKVKELSAMYGVAKLLSSQTDLRLVLEETLDILAREMGLQRGMITLLNREMNEVHLDIAIGLSEKDAGKIRYGLGEGVTGKVVATGMPMIIPKLDEEPSFLDRTGIRKTLDRSQIAFICVPIMHGGDTIGALSVDTVSVKNSSMEDEVRFLEAIADMIAQTVKLRREQDEERKRLELENERLRRQIEGNRRPGNIIGNSRIMQDIYVLINQVADSNTTALVTGETGTGKELVAQAIHASSPRRDGPFVRVNCTVLPENLLENELFGHEKGAFTGATDRYVGRFERANGGTIFLDEIGDLSPSAQVKLLRILEEKELERLGGGAPIRVNVRVIAATNRDLEAEVEAGKFRADLFYRLNVFPIHLPPLRERGADIIMLADYFVQKYSAELKKNVTRINTPAIDAMMAYHWPGNVRELENSIERAVLLCSDDTIHMFNLPPSLQVRLRPGRPAETSGKLEELVEIYERDLIEDALKTAKGNQTKAARLLGATKRIIQYKIQKYGIDYERYKSKKRAG